MSCRRANTCVNLHDVELDFDKLVGELIRARRGRRSQLALSRRLGFKTNVVYTWENGKRSPTAGQLLRLVQRTGCDVRAALRRFVGRQCAWLDQHEPWSGEGIVELLGELRGAMPITQLAQGCGVSRFAVSRWLSATSEPRAAELLAVVHHCSQRLSDLTMLFCEAPLPSLASETKRLAAARQIARTHPWSQLVLRHLELAAYTRLSAHQPGWIAARAGISLEEEEGTLTMLVAAGQASWTGTHFSPNAIAALDMRKEPKLVQSQRAFWAKVASERAPSASEGVCAYNIFCVSQEGYQQLKLLQREFLQKARAIIATAHPEERVALMQLNLVPFDDQAPEP